MQNIEKTFVLIKPHVLKNPIVLKRIQNFISNNFRIIQTKEIYMNESLARQFYEEHIGRFYFKRLQTLMSSGPSLAMIISSNNCVAKWRELIGPTKVYKSIYSNPNSLRSLYGLSDTRNACHGSDSPKSANREISIIFPELKT